LKNRYKTIAFSGNVKARIEYLNKKYNFRKVFDKEVYSFDHHINKPAKKFVEIMVRESGVKPEEIVYIDDDEYHSKEAHRFGIKVLIYKRGEIQKLKKQLRKMGITF
jgi:FMN phosphatase YigB (HAD superfamily)